MEACFQGLSILRLGSWGVDRELPHWQEKPGALLRDGAAARGRAPSTGFDTPGVWIFVLLREQTPRSLVKILSRERLRPWEPAAFLGLMLDLVDLSPGPPAGPSSMGGSHLSQPLRALESMELSFIQLISVLKNEGNNVLSDNTRLQEIRRDATKNCTPWKKRGREM